MRMNKTYGALLALLLLCVLCVTFAACDSSDIEHEEREEQWSAEPFEPVQDLGRESELYARYEEYAQKSELAFSANEPLDGSAFEYEITDGYVTVKKYIGQEAVIVIPQSIDGAAVCAIASGAFSGGGVRAVYIPDTVSMIAKGAFNGCDALSTLRLPFIGDGGEIGYLGYIFGASEPDENAVKVPSSLDMVIVGDQCGTVAQEAFRRCKTLSAVIFEGEVEQLGKLAFYECDDLVYITLDMVSGEIGEYAFAFCDSLYLADVSNAIDVGDGAFYSCSAINSLSVRLQDGDFLGRYFGAETHELNEEFISRSLRVVSVAEGCEKIHEFAFAGCKYLTEVNLPESLCSIGIRAFSGCRSLRSVKIPDGVKTICDDAFFGCDALSSLILGEGLESIGMQAFFGCKRLEAVEFPSSLMSIGASAFYGCEALETADVGEAVSVGKDALPDRSSDLDGEDT